MYSPVLVSPVTDLAISLDEAKLHLRVAFPDEDGTIPATEEDPLIEAYIRAATAHLDAPNGILDRCLQEQTWRIDFDGFCSRLVLPLSPVGEIGSVTWRNAAGQLSTVDDDEYLTETDDRGGVYLRFRNSYQFPVDLYERRAVGVTFQAGYPSGELPAPLKVAILLLVGTWFENREATVSTAANELPFAVKALISPFRRMSV